MEKKTNVKQTPFFAKYLEGQQYPEVKTNVKAGMTLKYPSDSEDHTQKHPSDADEL